MAKRRRGRRCAGLLAAAALAAAAEARDVEVCAVMGPPHFIGNTEALKPGDVFAHTNRSKLGGLEADVLALVFADAGFGHTVTLYDDEATAVAAVRAKRCEVAAGGVRPLYAFDSCPGSCSRPQSSERNPLALRYACCVDFLQPAVPTSAAAAAVLLTRVPTVAGAWRRILDALLTYDTLNVCLVSLSIAFAGGHALWLVERRATKTVGGGPGMRTAGYVGASEGVLSALRLVLGLNAGASAYEASPRAPLVRLLALGLSAVGAATLALVVASTASRLTVDATSPHTHWAATNVLGALPPGTVVCVPTSSESAGARELVRDAGSHLRVVSAKDVSACVPVAGANGAILVSTTEAAWLLRRPSNAIVAPGVAGTLPAWRASAPITVPSVPASAFAVDEVDSDLVKKLGLSLARVKERAAYERVVRTHLCLPPLCALHSAPQDFDRGGAIAPGAIGTAVAFLGLFALVSSVTVAYESRKRSAGDGAPSKPNKFGCFDGALFSGGGAPANRAAHPASPIQSLSSPTSPIPGMATNALAANSRASPARGQGSAQGAALLSLLRDLERRQDMQQEALLQGIAALMQSNVAQMDKLSKFDVASVGAVIPSVINAKANKHDVAMLEGASDEKDFADEDVDETEDDDDDSSVAIQVEVTDEAVAAEGPRLVQLAQTGENRMTGPVADSRPLVRHPEPTTYSTPTYVGSGIGRRRSEVLAHDRPTSPKAEQQGPAPLPTPPEELMAARFKLAGGDDSPQKAGDAADANGGGGDDSPQKAGDAADANGGGGAADASGVVAEPRGGADADASGAAVGAPASGAS